MSERLTEGDLQALIINASHMGQTAKYIAFEAVAEIRERRAAGLSDADREALANAMLYVTAWSEHTASTIERGRCKLALAVLSRLVERKP